MTSAADDLVSPYAARPQFLRLHNRTTRWFIAVAHRRAGKTVADINELVIGSTKCGQPDPRFAYVAPRLNQAKDIAWTYLKEFTAFLPGRKTKESELWVECATGGKRTFPYRCARPGVFLASK
jgi:hypothetical protein